MTRGLHWFRNDLRLRDNTALNALVSRADAWLPVFVLDERILSGPASGASRTRFLLDCLERLARELAERGVPLLVRSGRPEDLLPKLMNETGARVLSFGRDATPFARRRDAAVRRAVEREGGKVVERLDHVVFAASEIRTGSGGGYSVYTPYRKAWWRRYREEPRPSERQARLPAPIPGFEADPIPTPAELAIGQGAPDLPAGGERAALRRLDAFLEGPARRYHEDRDRPDLDGTSRLSPYLRFGVISPRECFDRGLRAGSAEPALRPGVGKWLDELVWREFYAAILEEHPRVLSGSHRSEYDALAWNDDPDGFEAWCAGRTGHPIVDAGMRQLAGSGWVHNRVRMLVASFLTKDLLIDWRAGERFFFQQLVDGDPASNNGGWQWSASTGSDAQPWFRIFNPVTQGRRFDPEGRYVRRWLPELAPVPDRYVHAPWEWEGAARLDYPPPRVDHAERRLEALARYRAVRA